MRTLNKYSLLAIFILSIYLIGAVWCQEVNEAGFIVNETRELAYHMDQKVDGNGFSSSYQDITSGALHLENKRHGSGSYSHESNVSAYVSIDKSSPLIGKTSLKINETDIENISYNEHTDFAYAPQSLHLGRSFKANGFQSRGKEETCIKNYDEGTSMTALFDSIDALRKDLWAKMYFEGSEVEFSPESIIDDEDEEETTLTGSTALNVNTAFTGKAHFGALEVNNEVRDIDNIAQVNSSIVHDTRKLVDEDYIGTFTLAKKMSRQFDAKKGVEDHECLPCPCGSVLDAIIEQPDYFKDSKGFGYDVRPIFDCTCPRGFSNPSSRP